MEKCHIIRGIINGSKQSLEDMGLSPNIKIKSVCTILRENEDLLTTQLRHWYNVFYEDPGHDWTCWKGIFKYHPHSSDIGEKCDIIIIEE